MYLYRLLSFILNLCDNANCTFLILKNVTIEKENCEGKAIIVCRYREWSLQRNVAIKKNIYMRF